MKLQIYFQNRVVETHSRNCSSRTFYADVKQRAVFDFCTQGMQTVHKIASLEVATSSVVFLFEDDYSYQMLLLLL